MVPKSNMVADYDVKNGTKAYRIDFDNKKIGEIIDEKEALLQWIRLSLMTQRYKYGVFSHSFGTDYKNAFEEGYVKAMGIIRNAVYDSLIYDDRIIDVNNFSFERIKMGMKINFTVHSVYGRFNYERVVNNV